MPSAQHLTIPETPRYPCDAVSTEKLVLASAERRGIVYLRTTRMATPLVYDPDEEFPIGGSKVLRGGSTTPRPSSLPV